MTRYMRRLALCTILATVLAAGGCMAAAESTEDDTVPGEESFTAGEFDTAVLELQDAVIEDPENPKSHFLLAQAYEATAELALAEESYLRSIELDPAQPQALHNVAMIQEAAGRTDEAIDNLELALGADEAFVGAKMALADLLAECGEVDAAKNLYEEILADEPFGIDLDQIVDKIDSL